MHALSVCIMSQPGSLWTWLLRYLLTCCMPSMSVWWVLILLILKIILCQLISLYMFVFRGFNGPYTELCGAPHFIWYWACHLKLLLLFYDFLLNYTFNICLFSTLEFICWKQFDCYGFYACCKSWSATLSTAQWYSHYLCPCSPYWLIGWPVSGMSLAAARLRTIALVPGTLVSAISSYCQHSCTNLWSLY